MSLTSCASGGDEVEPADAVVGVRGTACDEATRGVGVVVGDDRVLTNAHVVAGAGELDVEGQNATVIGFDPNRDLALLSVPGLDRSAVELATAAAGDVGTLVAIDAIDSLVRHPYEIRRPIRATGEDIYRIEGANRRAFEVEVEFAQGWSGSGMFDGDGRLVGVVFAESRTDPEVAYAVRASEVEAFLDGVDAGSVDEVDAGPCL